MPSLALIHTVPDLVAKFRPLVGDGGLPVAGGVVDLVVLAQAPMAAALAEGGDETPVPFLTSRNSAWLGLHSLMGVNNGI